MTKRKIHLKYAGLQPRTLRAYRLAIDNFLHFAGKDAVTTLKPKQLDALLAEFINMAFQEGDPLTYSGHLLSALKRFHPELRMKLPIASQYLRNWTRAHVPKRAVPASWELVEAMIALALHRNDEPLALLLGVGFHAMLRTSEMMQLTVNHLMIHSSHQAFSVVIPTAKTSQGNPQVLQIKDDTLLVMAQRVQKALQPKQLLWKAGPHSFRRTFQKLLTHLGFPVQSYLPYSLRRGGATWYYQSTLNLDATMTRGRWACQKTCRIYVDTGTMQLAHLSWTPKQAKRVRQWRLKGVQLRLRQRKTNLVRD